ncbi:hypothetical protein [Shouchella clausii]|uniref:hypothetical protein n=1 Tax=Shouchella clausii TaxID=79880 RepID=UPI000BA6F00A|nr:hypothetical protein [Shouchella clausii]PAD93978.1 hypothetical protein CHH52_01840 [Shouchella clausii]
MKEVDLFNMFLWLDIETILKIIEDTELLFEERMKIHDEKLKEISEIKEWDQYEEYLYHFEGEIDHYSKSGIFQLRNSFFLTSYNLFESKVRELAKTRVRSEFEMEDLKGQLTVKIKKYFTKASNVPMDFFKGDRWNRINNYGEIRNCIAHEGGEILRENRKQIADEFKGMRVSDLGYLEIDRGFCEFMLNDLYDFLCDLNDKLFELNIDNDTIF